MMFWLGSLLAVAFALAAIAVISQATWIKRSVRRPTALAATTLLTALVGIPVAVSIATSLPQSNSDWTQCTVGLEVIALFGLVVMFFTLRHPRNNPARPRRVLAVGAHPDDLELACGGSLARFADQGHEVMAIVMSHGDHGGDGDVRVEEARAGAASLELSGIAVQDFTDSKMATEIEGMVRVIETAVNLFHPDVILTHSAHDQHQDHHAVHLATMRAGRRCSTILCFESPSATREFAPSYFVDISSYVDAKIAAVQRHKDQAAKPYMGAQVLRGAAVFRGSQARTSHAEGFEIMRALSSGVGDL